MECEFPFFQGYWSHSHWNYVLIWNNKYYWEKLSYIKLWFGAFPLNSCIATKGYTISTLSTYKNYEMLSFKKLIQVLKLKHFNFISFKAISYNSSHLQQPIADGFLKLITQAIVACKTPFLAWIWTQTPNVTQDQNPTWRNLSTSQFAYLKHNPRLQIF